MKWLWRRWRKSQLRRELKEFRKAVRYMLAETLVGEDYDPSNLRYLREMLKHERANSDYYQRLWREARNATRCQDCSQQREKTRAATQLFAGQWQQQFLAGNQNWYAQEPVFGTALFGGNFVAQWNAAAPAVDNNDEEG